jgi:hypothetical protein
VEKCGKQAKLIGPKRKEKSATKKLNGPIPKTLNRHLITCGLYDSIEIHLIHYSKKK